MGSLHTNLIIPIDCACHTLTINQLPLFGSIASTGSVANLNLEAAGTVEIPDEGNDLGTLANTNSGSITNCRVSANVTLDATNTGPKSLYLGGLVGANEGIIANVASYAAFTLKPGGSASLSVATGAVVGTQKNGTLANCFAAPVSLGKTPTQDHLLTIEAGTSPSLAAYFGAVAGAVQGGATLNLVTAKGLDDSKSVAPTKATVSSTDTDRDNKDLNELPNVATTAGTWRLDRDAALAILNDPDSWTYDETLGMPITTLGLAPIPQSTANLTIARDPNGRLTLQPLNAAGVIEAFALLAKGGEMVNANVTLPESVEFDKISLADLKGLTDAQVRAKLPTLPVVPEFNGSISTSNMHNIAVCAQGLFGKLGADAVVTGLTLDEAILYIDPSTSPGDGATVYAPILAATVAGAATIQVGFSGSVLIDDSKIPKGKEVAVCLVDQFDEANTALNGYLFLDEVETPGSNKACITIKQNLGTGRNKPGGGINPPRQKVATNGGPASKALALTDPYTTATNVNDLTRIFADDAFQNGAVAYWLNYDGLGYAGTYRPRWSQGARQPVAALPLQSTTGTTYNATYRVDYKVIGDDHLTSGPLYHNNGSTIKLTYDVKPVSVVNGATQATLADNSTLFKFDAASPVVVTFNKAAEHTDALPKKPADTQQAQAATQVTLQGNTLTISPAQKGRKQLLNLLGSVVDATEGNTLTAPTPGIYFVTLADRAFKVLVK